MVDFIQFIANQMNVVLSWLWNIQIIGTLNIVQIVLILFLIGWLIKVLKTN